MPIRPLPPDVVALIAAGEVVERPASVAKELIENALDAGATQVQLEVQAGGVRLLRVVDNGAGIPAEELGLAFQRHATSKLSDALDLHHITTLGFRGEALASIGAVADVTLLTRTAGSLGGSFMRVVNGKVIEHGAQGAPPGTSITVRNLFRDVPARLKFLKSNATEAGRITTVVTHYALAYPGVRFTVTVDGRGVFSSPGTGQLRDAAAQLYGPDTAQAMLPVDHEEAIGGASVLVSGLVSPPSITRASRGYIHLFINGRPVENRTLPYAIIEGYQGLLMGGRYPLAVLALAIDPAEVDANVHPAKAQVKLRDEGVAFAAVHHAVKGALATVPLARSVRTTPSASTAFGPLVPQPASLLPRPAPAPASSPLPGGAAIDTRGAGPAGAPALGVPILRVLGQVANTFIISEGPDGMYLIDQHAAHERVLFDQLRRERGAGRPISQSLLEPATIELTPQQAALVESRAAALRAWGFEIEPFGGRAVLLRAVPSLLIRQNPARAFLDTLEYVESQELEGYDWENRVLATVACHGAIRAGQRLSPPEMAEMVRLLETADNPHACPHGRPVMVHMSNAQLEKEFYRR